MFGKKQKEYEQPELSELPQQALSPETALDLDPRLENTPEVYRQEIIAQPEEPVPEMVKVIDKISGILSPYFIVIVGLYLYKENFLIGFALITVGISSLLKISFKDIGRWIEGLLSFLGVK